MLDPLPYPAPAAAREAQHAAVLQAVAAMIDGEHDVTAVLATAACELHHAFDAYHWTGFYRALADDRLVVGPYQGGHGCLRIDGGRGVCGTAATRRETVVVPDVEAFPGHIACSTTTRSEVVVPVIAPSGRLIAVLDVDSDHPAAFDAADVAGLEALAALLGAHLAGPEDGVRAALREQVAAWNRGDLEGFVALCAQDVVYVTGEGLVTSRAALRDAYARAWDAGSMGELSADVVTADVAEDHGVVVIRWGLTGSAADRGGHALLVFRREPDGWKLSHDATARHP